MSWEGKRVLVTGAGGFIGSHLTEELVRQGADVTAFLRYTSRGHDGLLRLLPPDMRGLIRTVHGDLRDFAAVRQACANQDVVFHLGALIAIPYSYQHPVEVVQTNVMGSLNVLMAAREFEPERVVMTSTSEVYGTAQIVPIPETHPLQGQSPYSASKIGQDAIAESFHRAFGVRVATLRPFNTYGPRQSGRAVIPTMIGQALQRDRIELGSLTPTRDLTYVGDTARAFLAVGSHPDAIGKVLNAGHGKDISIGGLAEMVLKILGKDMPILSKSERIRPTKSEVLQLVCDASEITRLTGWTPQVTLEQGLSHVIDFMREHPDWTQVDKYET